MICHQCNLDKELNEFGTKKRNGIIKNNRKCKSCLSKQKRDWYHKNNHQGRETARNNTRRRVVKTRRFLVEYLSSHPCVDCGNNNIIVLEFDHLLGEKKYKVAKMVMRGMSINSIAKEISKCEVRCANCHRIRHAKDSDFWYSKLQ